MSLFLQRHIILIGEIYKKIEIEYLLKQLLLLVLHLNFSTSSHTNHCKGQHKNDNIMTKGLSKHIFTKTHTSPLALRPTEDHQWNNIKLQIKCAFEKTFIRKKPNKHTAARFIMNIVWSIVVVEMPEHQID